MHKIAKEFERMQIVCDKAIETRFRICFHFFMENTPFSFTIFI